MARIFTTPDGEKAAKAWFHDVALAAGVRSNNLKTDTPVIVRYSSYSKYASTICDELVNRDFSNIDTAINSICDIKFDINFSNPSKYKKFNAEQVAKAIVYVAELLQLYWDDTIRTPYEIDEFKKTKLGEAVYKYGRYISAIPNKAPRSASAASKTPGQPPKNNYKQSGPQSGNIRDLQGNPGEKVYAEGSFIYKIIGDNPQSKNTPNVFIKPLSAAGATGSTNKIFISSGNGYTDCTCYFDDPNDATAFLNKILQKYVLPSNITNLRVVKNKADSNGYFLVGTEFGICAVSAKTLNEALKEAIEEPLADAAGWERATRNYSKEEYEELHTWMRRG